MTFRLGDVAVLPLPLATERRIRERGCREKVPFKTQESAEVQVATLYAKGKAKPGSLNVYHCRFCHDYHVGHGKFA